MEAGIPSGTFSTANCALDSSRDVWAVPGSVRSPKCAGCNKLIYDGATPIINDDVFADHIMALFKADFVAKSQKVKEEAETLFKSNPILNAASAHPMSLNELLDVASQYDSSNPLSYLNMKLVEAENSGFICKYKDGRYGPVIKD